MQGAETLASRGTMTCLCAFQCPLVVSNSKGGLHLKAQKCANEVKVRRRRTVYLAVIDKAISRRQSLQVLGFGLAFVANRGFTKHGSVDAAMYDTSVKVNDWTVKGDKKQMSTYMPQIKAGYEAVKDLQDTWDKKTKGFDGDVVRRILGTVGVSSPLVNIRKSFLGAWQAVAESGKVGEETIDELEELWNDVLNSISSIDFQLYSVSFTELDETKESLTKSGKAELDRMVDKYKRFLEKLPII